MPKRRWADQTLRELLEADATLTTERLNALAGSTPSADELNLLDTSAAGTVTASKVMTVDANLQISGWRRKVVSVDGGAINAAMAGAIVNNAPRPRRRCSICRRRWWAWSFTSTSWRRLPCGLSGWD